MNETQQDALANFFEAWGDGYLANDLGEKLTCREADAIAELFSAFGKDKDAEQWIDSHSFSDDEGDEHWIEG